MLPVLDPNVLELLFSMQSIRNFEDIDPDGVQRLAEKCNRWSVTGPLSIWCFIIILSKHEIKLDPERSPNTLALSYNYRQHLIV